MTVTVTAGPWPAAGHVTVPSAAVTQPLTRLIRVTVALTRDCHAGGCESQRPSP